MKRRTFLAGSGVALGSLAGCLGGGQGTGSGDGDGYPPTSNGTTPESREIDASSFPTLSVSASQISNSDSDVEVPAAPIDATYYWHQRREARFADARGQTQYENAHVLGAVLSTAGTDIAAPVSDWPTDDRIVCYCACPHHLSKIRAAELTAAGYSEVYVIDEGFGVWYDRDYPMAGQQLDRRPPRFTLRGVVDASHAGEAAWVRHEPSGQREVTDIGDGGEFELSFGFYGVTAESEVLVETPDYRFTGVVGDLVDGVVSGPRD